MATKIHRESLAGRRQWIAAEGGEASGLALERLSCARRGSRASITCLAGGQVAGSWAIVDQLGMLIQLGVVPAPGGAPVSA